MDEMEIVRRLYHMFYLMRRESFRMASEHQAPHPIGGRDLMMLDAIVQNGNQMKMSEISSYFHITPAAVSQMIRSFEKKNWVERILLENDRRSVYIKVSEQGAKMIEQNEKHVTEKLVEFIEMLGEDDAQALIRIMEKAHEHARRMKEEGCCRKGDHHNG